LETTSARFEPYIGRLMKDGTVFVGISPDTHKALYTTVVDAPLIMTFNVASGYAAALEINNRKGFRLPTLAEMDMICANGDKGALKGTFNQDPTSEDVDKDAAYWTSDIAPHVTSHDGSLWLMTRVFNQSVNSDVSTSCAGGRNLYSVRCVREGVWPDALDVHEVASSKQEWLKHLPQRRKLKIEAA
jgi:hypothetical protein